MPGNDAVVTVLVAGVGTTQQEHAPVAVQEEVNGGDEPESLARPPFTPNPQACSADAPLARIDRLPRQYSTPR